jgi:hypothetical protein
MKKLYYLIIAIILFTRVGFNQQWQYVEDFVVNDFRPHGIVVTPDNKIWIGYYSYSDSIHVGGGVYVPTKPLWIYNPDGSLHHKIQFLTYNGVTDTLFNSCRGLSLDNNGNVLYSNWYTMRRINYQTYEEMNQTIPYQGNSITEMACDANGFIYVHRVVASGTALNIYDSNFQFYNTVIDSSFSISRTLLVSPDGNDVYLGRIYGGNQNGIIRYHSDNGPDGPYTVVDTVQKNIWAGQSMDWDNEGFLWAGSYWDVGLGDLDGWYKLDPGQNLVIVDSIGQNAGSPIGTIPPPGATFYAPRGAVWSTNGAYMYTADFDGGVIKKWYNPDANISYIDISIPDTMANHNDTLLVPIKVELPVDSLYSSFDLVLSGYSNKIEFINIVTDSSLVGDAGWNVQWFQNDSLKINAVKDTSDISGIGTLLWLKFYIPDTINMSYTVLNLDYVAFDSSTSYIRKKSGFIYIISPHANYGDVDINSHIQAYDAALVLKYIVGLIPLSAQQLLNANVSLDTTISALDASYILQYVVGLIPSLPYLSGNNVNASGTIQMNNIDILQGQIVEIPMVLTNGENIMSYQGEIRYNPNHLKYINNDPGPVLNDFIYEIFNDSTSGIIKIGGSNSISGNYNDILTTMRFKVQNYFSGDSTAIYLQNFRWNEDDKADNLAKSVLYLLTSINKDDNNLPKAFKLYQNYPNPFNSNSTIRYDLPKQCDVKLDIYDMLGRHVRTIVNSIQTPGHKTAIWDSRDDSGNRVSTGIYIYRIKAGRFIQSKKIILLK